MNDERKPWEGTWHYNGTDIVETRNGVDNVYVIVTNGFGEQGAITLAAAAPELARALLFVEFTAGEYPHCVACGEDAPRHDKGCPVNAALKKAGVR